MGCSPYVLTREQAIEVLQLVFENMDAEMGINWDVIKNESWFYGRRHGLVEKTPKDNETDGDNE